jgi:hypothetical protein
MVRIHVPEERRDAFGAAIAALGRRRRLLHVSLEPGQEAAVLALHDSEGPARELARVEGHGRWIEPLP